MVLGQFPPWKTSPNPKTNPNLNPNPNPNRGGYFSQRQLSGYPLKYVSLKHSVTIAVFCP